MIRSRAWDKFETALLIESYIKIEQGLVSRSLELEGLSKRLRQMAINRGETIDDTFRNFNGMNWQCALIKQVFQNTTYSDRNNSKIFIEMVQLYQTDRLAFDQILGILELVEATSTARKDNSVCMHCEYGTDF